MKTCQLILSPLSIFFFLSFLQENLVISLLIDPPFDIYSSLNFVCLPFLIEHRMLISTFLSTWEGPLEVVI